MHAFVINSRLIESTNKESRANYNIVTLYPQYAKYHMFNVNIKLSPTTIYYITVQHILC